MSSLYIVLIVLSCVYSAFLRKSTNFGIYLEISSGFEKNISNDIEEPRFRYFICNKSEDSKSEIMQLLDRSRYTIKEMYQFISSEAKRLQSFHDAHDQILDGIADMKLISGEFLNVMENNLNFIERKQKLHVERHLRLRILSEKIQTRISDLQNNPAYCTNNKVIICNLTSVFGFASGVHELLWCFINAFKEGKLVHVKTSNWHYTPGKEWVYLSFLPLAVNCVGNPTLIKKRKSPWPGINDPRVRAKINRLPKQVIKELPWLGDDPLAWWFGQIIGYLLRPDESLQHHIDLIKKDLEYRNPLVGIHIRRTDKIGLEAIHHTVDEYMNYVNHHFSRLNSFNEENTPIEGEESNKMKYRNGTVFVATDDPEAISELIEKYPMYRFIYQQNSSQIANDINARDTGLGVKTLITDLFLLASTDHIVCTMSSGFCRLAYELANFLSTSGDKKISRSKLPSVSSLDVPHHYAWSFPPRRKVINSQNTQIIENLSAKLGDILEKTDGYEYKNNSLANKNMDGFEEWRNIRTMKKGKFPNFKTSVIHEEL